MYIFLFACLVLKCTFTIQNVYVHIKYNVNIMQIRDNLLFLEFGRVYRRPLILSRIFRSSRQRSKAATLSGAPQNRIYIRWVIAYSTAGIQDDLIFLSRKSDGEIRVNSITTDFVNWPTLKNINYAIIHLTFNYYYSFVSLPAK